MTLANMDLKPVFLVVRFLLIRLPLIIHYINVSNITSTTLIERKRAKSLLLTINLGHTQRPKWGEPKEYLLPFLTAKALVILKPLRFGLEP